MKQFDSNHFWKVTQPIGVLQGSFTYGVTQSKANYLTLSMNPQLNFARFKIEYEI